MTSSPNFFTGRKRESPVKTMFQMKTAHWGMRGALRWALGALGAGVRPHVLEMRIQRHVA